MADLLITTPTSEPLVSLAPFSSDARLFNEEKVRLGTYKAMESLEGCHPVLMARAGLYYTGTEDAVQCYSCSSLLTNWRSQSVDPVQLHRQTAPECAHVLGEDSTNVAITAPDAEAVTGIKEYLRQRCLELDRNPTQVYYDLCQAFSEIGGVSRGEVFVGGPGDLSAEEDLFRSGPSLDDTGPIDFGPGIESSDAEGPRVEFEGDLIHLEPVEENPEEAVLQANSPGIDFDLCKTSVHERLKTFEHWPVIAQVHPTHLAEAGFVYTGPEDRVQCVFCEGSLRNWQQGDVPSEEHSRHFPSCPLIRNSQGTVSEVVPVLGPPSPFPYAETSRGTPPPLPPSSIELADVGASSPAPLVRRDFLGVVTDRPKHPNMAVEATRIGSFTTWSAAKRQTPQQLAKAGFFYAGFNDSVKCFFCDGGLRNWEPEDDPWHEHARWFPMCKYVRQVKGDAFVEDVRLHEDGRVQQTATFEVPERTRRSSSSTGGEGERSRSRSGSAGRRECTDRRQPVEPREVLARMDTQRVREVLNMDIPQELVRRAIEHRLRTTGDDFPSSESLLETVFELSARSTTPLRHAGSGEPSPVNTGSPVRRPNSGEHLVVGEAPRALLEENRQLKEQRTCKICMDEEVCVVFVPCGHLVCCATCAPPLSKCPICRSTIRGTVRTYMS